MSCTHPRMIVNPKLVEVTGMDRKRLYEILNRVPDPELYTYNGVRALIKASCGCCLSCRASKAKEWSKRLLDESNYWEKCSFLTLTYDDLHLPDCGVRKSDLQKFFKRLRRRLGSRKIKYFACGEYGDNWRGHYHSILYGVGPEERQVMIDCWQNCDPLRVTLDPISVRDIQYVCGYVREKLDKYYNDEVYFSRGLALPFQLCSQGLGLRFALDNSKQIHQHYSMTFNGSKIAVPRYYAEKIGLDKDLLADASLKRVEIRRSRIASEIGSSDLHYIARAESLSLLQDAFNASAVQALRKERRKKL